MKITNPNWKWHVTHANHPSANPTINITPESTDDIWTLYNLIKPKDFLLSTTTRKVQNEKTTQADYKKMKLTLGVRVVKVDIDLGGACLRVNGRNEVVNDHVKIGAFHTIEVEPHRWCKFTKDSWDNVDVEMMEQAISSGAGDMVGGVLLDKGIGILFSVSKGMTTVLDRIEVKQNRFKKEAQETKLLQRIVNSVAEKFDIGSIAVFLAVGEPQLVEDIMAMYKISHPSLIKKKILPIPTKSQLNPQSIPDLLNSPKIASMLEETRGQKEKQCLSQFFKMNADENTQSTFGKNPVNEAAKMGAVKSLLISDFLFRSLNLEERKFYSFLIQNVKDNGGDVWILVGENRTELEKFGGIAAILYFPVE